MNRPNVFACLFAAALLLTLSCGGEARRQAGEGQTAQGGQGTDQAGEAAARDTWWAALSALCGNAYPGALTSEDPVDAEWAGRSMTMHVRRCERDRLEIPFHVGDDRSRTWILTRSEAGLRLQHDHRHEDGTEADVTFYGGRTESAGTASVQQFPVDDFSKQLFATNGLAASMTNVWSMEIVSGERFSYILRRPGREFQADFDLGRPVDPPAAPWGHEP